MGLPVKIRGLEVGDWGWISERAHPVLCEDTDGIVATRDDELVAAMVFDSFCEQSCSCHLVIEDPFVIRHDFLWYAFSYPFIAREKELVIGYVPGDNKEALRLREHLGFREGYRIPEAYKKGVDLVILEMRKDECRWLDRRFKRAA